MATKVVKVGGLQLQITETAGEASRFITDVAIVPAMRQDNQCLTPSRTGFYQRGILPRSSTSIRHT